MNLVEHIFPKSRTEIIRLLFTDPTRKLHLRDLARLSGLAVGTIQREVANMRKIGLLIEERDGNRLYFKVNTSNPIFPELQSIILKTTGLRKQFAEALNDLEGIDLAFVYGSFANGTPSPESDIDLFIIGSVGLRTLASRLRQVAEKMSREINPTVISPASYKKKLEASDTYIQNVTNGKKLWIFGNDNELGSMA